MAKKNIIPKSVANGCPEKCPVCGEKCGAVFRTWKPTGRVSVTFCHVVKKGEKKKKDCLKTYDTK